MLNFVFAGILLLTQLQLPDGGLGQGLPQIVRPNYSADPIGPGRQGEVVVSLDVLDGYVINRIPQMQLKLESVRGLTLAESEMLSPTEDPKSTDSYYVDVPDFTVSFEATRAGRYEIPGELTYFFCSLADGFCSRQIIAVNLPVMVR